jgi:hypothetical protein
VISKGWFVSLRVHISGSQYLLLVLSPLNASQPVRREE